MSLSIADLLVIESLPPEISALVAAHIRDKVEAGIDAQRWTFEYEQRQTVSGRERWRAWAEHLETCSAECSAVVPGERRTWCKRGDQLRSATRDR